MGKMLLIEGQICYTSEICNKRNIEDSLKDFEIVRIVCMQEEFDNE